MKRSFNIERETPQRLHRRRRRYYALRNRIPIWWDGRAQGSYITFAFIGLAWISISSSAAALLLIAGLLIVGARVAIAVARTGSPPELLIQPCAGLLYRGRTRRLRDRINTIEVRLQLLDVEAGSKPRLRGTLLD